MKREKRYKWLLFDLDNTLVDFNASSKDAFVQLMKKLRVKNPEKLYPIYNKINHQCWDEREAGLITPEVLKRKRWQLFFNKMKMKYDPLKANDFYFRIIQTNPVFIKGAEQLLKDLQGKYKLMMITNGLSEVQNPRIKILKLAQYFEHVVISDEIGVAKPQKAFFTHCEKLMRKVDKKKVLVIGDTLKSDIKGGNKFGYDTCWYNYYKKPLRGEIFPDYTVSDIETLACWLKA